MSQHKTLLLCAAAAAAAAALAAAFLHGYFDDIPPQEKAPTNKPTLRDKSPLDLGQPPDDIMDRLHATSEECSTKDRERSLVEYHIFAIHELLAHNNIDSVTQALQHIRCLRYEFDDIHDTYVEIFNAVAPQLIQATTAICTLSGAKGDLSLAGSLVGELHQLNIAMYEPGEPHSQRDFILFCLAVLQKSGTSPHSNIYNTVKGSADFSDRTFDRDAKGNLIPALDNTFTYRDSLAQYNTTPYFSRSTLMKLIDNTGPAQASAYLDDVARIYQAQTVSNPRSALAGLACVLGSAQEISDEESSGHHETARSAQDSILEIVTQKFQGQGPVTRERKINLFAELSKLEQTLEELSQFGVDDPGFFRQIALIARPNVARHATDPRVKYHWSRILKRFQIDDQSLLF